MDAIDTERGKAGVSSGRLGSGSNQSYAYQDNIEAGSPCRLKEPTPSVAHGGPHRSSRLQRSRFHRGAVRRGQGATCGQDTRRPLEEEGSLGSTSRLTHRASLERRLAASVSIRSSRSRLLELITRLVARRPPGTVGLASPALRPRRHASACRASDVARRTAPTRRSGPFGAMAPSCARATTDVAYTPGWRCPAASLFSDGSNRPCVCVRATAHPRGRVEFVLAMRPKEALIPATPRF